jgi:hypothetical protein
MMMPRNDIRAFVQNESERTATMTIDEVQKPAAGRTDTQDAAPQLSANSQSHNSNQTSSRGGMLQILPCPLACGTDARVSSRVADCWLAAALT